MGVLIIAGVLGEFDKAVDVPGVALEKDIGFIAYVIEVGEVEGQRARRRNGG